MTLYSIFEKPQAKPAAPAGPVAIAERFSVLAMVLPPVFALLHGLWLLLVFWIGLVVGLYFAARIIGDDAAIALYVLVAVFLGLEAPAFRRDGLLFRGYTWRGDIVSSAEDLAQRDYLASRK